MKTVKAFQRKGGKVGGKVKVRGDRAYYSALGKKGVEARRAKAAGIPTTGDWPPNKIY